MFGLKQKTLLALLLGVSQLGVWHIADAYIDTTSRILIFQSKATMLGKLTTSSASALENADAICSQDAHCLSHNCVAMIAYPGVRQPAVDGKQDAIGWVLFADKPYVNIYGQTVGTTNHNGVFNFNLKNLDYAVIKESSDTAWTGFYTDWTVSASNCSNWTRDWENRDDDDKCNATAGDVKSISSTMLSVKNASCGGYTKRSLYCVNTSPITDSTV
ncbi:MAG: DUF1554 domain-containing protein [Pseudomonadota bacterium]